MKIIVFTLALIIPLSCALAQQSWTSPDIEQMYKHANDDLERKNYQSAIVTYRQTIQLAPEKIILYKELSTALYLTGKYREAEQTLNAVIEKMDAGCYRILASSQKMQGRSKTAKATLQSGLTRFPTSGILYEELGTQYKNEEKPGKALNAWLDGILNDPQYPKNYLHAANSYLVSGNPLWGLLYGEIFLCMAHDTGFDSGLKQKIFAGYKTVFNNIANINPQLKNGSDNKNAASFEESVIQIYSLLTPVISDGITTENLTMVRTRFLMDWFMVYGKKYPFSLFAYQHELVKAGRFDIYNQWLFGKAENEHQYNAWNTFHEGDMDRFKNWKKSNLLHPMASDSYNLHGLDVLSGKRQ